MLSCVVPVINFLRMAIPIISLFGSAPIFFLLWFFLRLITSICFPRHIYRRCDDYLYSIYQQFVLFFFENWVNVKIYFHGDYEQIIKRKENVLYISNHQSSGRKIISGKFLLIINLVDWITVNMLAIRQGSLGHIRYVLKNDLKWIPFYGFYFQQVKH
jgi:lysophosphatidate acyltransferase